MLRGHSLFRRTSYMWQFNTRNNIKTQYPRFELNRLTGNKNIINYIKAQRLAWFGHIHRMPDDSMVKRVYKWSPALTRSLGRPKNRWQDDVKNDVGNLRITNWKDCIRNQSKWKEFVEKAETSPKL